ncbi:hypothetical protein HDZ31DRAFT_82484 [Schizophyllum fasciatum]
MFTNLSSLLRSIVFVAKNSSAVVDGTTSSVDEDSPTDLSLNLVDARAGLGLGHPSTSSQSIASLAGRVAAPPAPIPTPALASKKKSKTLFGLPLFSTPASPMLPPLTGLSAFDSFTSSAQSLQAYLESPNPASPTPTSPNPAYSRGAAHALRPAFFPRRVLYDIPEEASSSALSSSPLPSPSSLPSPSPLLMSSPFLLPSPLLMPSPGLLSPLPALPRHRGPLLVWNPESQTFGFYRSSPLLTSAPALF